MTKPLVGPWSAVGIAALAGIVLALAFDPIGFGPYAIAGVALMTVAIIGRRARAGFALGLLTGIIFFATVMDWMRVIGVDAWLLLAVYCGLWMGLIGLGTALVTRLPGWPIWVAGWWVLSEGLRGRIPLGGFPWARLAFTQSEQDLSAWTYLIGMAGMSGLLALIGASVVAVGLAITRRERGPIIGWTSVIALPFVFTTFWQPSVSGAPVTVAFVQGGTPQLGMGALDVRREVLNNHVSQTEALGRAITAGEVDQPAFVLWPENSTDIDPFTDPSVAADISRAARAVNVPIIVGAVVGVPGNPMAVWNVGIVWSPDSGPRERYIKNRPVPFGEFVPFREQLTSIIGRFDRVPRDFLPGDVPGILDAGGVIIGDLICFEVAYDDVSHNLVRDGAQLITVQTNNATYGNTAQPEQQFAISRMRAVENGRAVLIASTTGVSGAIGPDRQIIEAMQQNEVGFGVVDVPTSAAIPPSAHIGWVLELLWGISAVIALAFAIPRRRTEHLGLST